MKRVETMRVTALVPTFNRSGFLKESLLSLLRQTRVPDEIIVIDDGSTDDTAQVVSSFGSQARYIRKVNGGKSSALNLGLKQATGDLIYILDDDDIAADDAIELMAEVLENRPEYGFVYGGFDVFSVSASGDIAKETRAQPPADEGLHLSLLHHNRIVVPSLMVRKICYQRVGPFNESFVRSQDYEMLLRLVRIYRAKRLDYILSHVRAHTGIRGSASVQVAATNSYEAWRYFDTKAITTIYNSYSLKEFLPQPVATLSNQDRFTALLQRCVIVGRKRLWNLATNDLKEACDLASQFKIHELTPRQSLILQRLFDTSSYGLHDLAAANDFRSVLLGIQDPALSKQIRAALSIPLRKQIQEAVHTRATRTFAYLGACFLCLFPWGGRGINRLGNYALEGIARMRSSRPQSEAVST
jgi:glycosyltransferase involved in cell wall biosynthesis